MQYIRDSLCIISEKGHEIILLKISLVAGFIYNGTFIPVSITWKSTFYVVYETREQS